MRTPFLTALVVALGAVSVSCGPPRPPSGMGAMPDYKRLQQQSEMMQKLASEPDIPPWYNQRERVAQAMGDRVFDKEFDRVFDSVTVALATLGANVNNMERQSGYITSAVPQLSPQREKQLQVQAAREWCRYNKYDPKLLEKNKDDLYSIDVFGMSGMGRMGQAMTISMVRQGKEQTKVKIRFSNIHYPGQLEEDYKTIWAAIDKQIFLDKGLD